MGYFFAFSGKNPKKAKVQNGETKYPKNYYTRLHLRDHTYYSRKNNKNYTLSITLFKKDARLSPSNLRADIQSKDKYKYLNRDYDFSNRKTQNKILKNILNNTFYFDML